MNEDTKKAMEAIERRAEEIKADGKMHNMLCDMAADHLLLCKWLRNAFEVIEKLQSDLEKR